MNPPTVTDHYHEGPVTLHVSRDGKWMSLLCPFGHLVDAREAKDAGGSMFLTNTTRVAKCYGHIGGDC